MLLGPRPQRAASPSVIEARALTCAESCLRTRRSSQDQSRRSSI